MKNKIKGTNHGKVAKSINKLPDQLREAWAEAKKTRLPVAFSSFDSIVFCGMGGSNLISELVRNIFRSEIKKPLTLVRGYNLPAFVSRRTLVFISSYSGNTEETVSCLNQAIAKKAKVICLSTGGQVISLAKKNKLSYYQLSKRFNPSNQPRYGIGSQAGAVLAILTKLKFLKLSDDRILEVAEHLNALNELLTVSVDQKENLAKGLAGQFCGFAPVIVAADFLSSNAHILANQINESAKSFATYFLIPELNHHLLDGLKNPSIATEKLKFLFLNSKQYSPSVAKRFSVTKKIIKKQNIGFVEYLIDSDDRLMASLEVLLLGSWFSFYLAQENGEDPTSIPWVDYLKIEMRKKS